jgi:hypothetical protein
MTEVPPAPPQSGSFGRAGDAWRDLGHRMRLVLADRIAPPRLNTPARLGGFRLSAGSRLALRRLASSTAISGLHRSMPSASHW